MRTGAATARRGEPLAKLLQGPRVLDGRQVSDGDSDEARVLRPLQAAACTYRIAFGPRAGQKVLTVQGAMPRDADFKQHLRANIDGFSLHAAVRCGADDRQALEQLCRYITRPALANVRIQTNATEQVVLKLKTAWRDGTTHLVCRRWSSCSGWLRWCHGHVYTSYASMACARSTPSCACWWCRKRQRRPRRPTQTAECEANCVHHRPVRLSWAKLLERVFGIDLE
jgi:hypothetical protein